MSNWLNEKVSLSQSKVHGESSLDNWLEIINGNGYPKWYKVLLNDKVGLLRRSIMRFLFCLSVVISGIVSIAGFALTKMTTSSFDPTGDNFVGGNGNPGLMFVMLPMLIILYFFFAMMFVFEKIHERFSVKRNLFQACYSGVFVLILGMTIYRIVSFRNEINPYFEYEISYLNPFSNDLFFNFWTFIACLCVSGFCSFYLKKRI